MTTRVNIGRMRHRLEVQWRGGSSAGAWGTVPTNHVSQGTFWGSIEPLSSAEALEFNRLGATATHRIRLRYNATLAAGVDSQTRFIYDSRLFYMVGPPRNIDERDHVWECIAVEEEGEVE